MSAPLYGFDLFGDPVEPVRGGALAQRYEFPPFSVLNARDGDWQERKRAWVALGIKSELGRGGPDGEHLINSDEIRNMDYFREKAGTKAPSGANFGYGIGGEKSILKGVQNHITEGTAPEIRERFEQAGSGASIFDPVLCEVAYKWWCPPGGQVVDPFAGGSVRGLVAAYLGRKYWGCELRAEQVAANEAQRHIAPTDADLLWHCGDAAAGLALAPAADFIFSCPPYGDLERYSDDPRDLSTMAWAPFVDAYRTIIAKACAKLREHRFAAFVVGDYRDDKTTHYRGFVQETIAAFRACGLGLYNDAVLVTSVGSLPVRVSCAFDAGRKLGKTHQNMLVFVKGDWRQAARLCAAEAQAA